MDTPEAQPPALGPRVELFTASRANGYVGFVLGVLLAVGGFAMAGCGLTQIPAVKDAPTPKAQEDAIGRLVGGLLVGGLLALFGILGVGVARSLAGTGVEVCENGFRRWPVGPDAIAVFWGEVARIEERFVRDEVPLKLGGPLLSEPHRVFVIVCRDGLQFMFSRENIGGLGRLGKLLKTIAERHAIPWVVIGKPA